MRRVGIALTALVAAGWLLAVVVTIRSADRREPGWSLAPVALVVVTVEAVVLVCLLWSVLALGRTTLRAWRAFRRPPDG